MNARMIYGPFSLEDADSANFAYHRYLRSEQSFDYFTWGVSVDSLSFHGEEVSGDSASWVRESVDLRNVPGLGNVCGKPKVWVAFGFQSNDSIADEGVYVDDILLRRHVAGAMLQRRTRGFEDSGVKRRTKGVKDSGIRGVCSIPRFLDSLIPSPTEGRKQ
jgi:bacillopeptidase F